VSARHRHVNDQNYAVDVPCRIMMSGSGQPGRIRARVIDRQTAQPVEDFIVSRRYVSQQRRILEQDGHFEWVDLTAGKEYSFQLYAKGYAPWRGPLKSVALNDQDTLSIALTPGRSLLVRISDANTREPVVGAPVLFGVLGDARYFEWGDWDRYIDGYHGLSWIQRATTDQDGRFWFCEDPMEPGTLFILTKGYGRAVVLPKDRPAMDPGGVVQIALHPEATIEGTVVENSRLESDANIRLYREQAGQHPEDFFEDTTTDDNGRFKFCALGPGIYHISLGRRPSRWTTRYQPLTKIELRPGEKKVLERLKISSEEQREGASH